ncbi:hypothetical protein [Microbacterium sp. GXF6406]
MIIADPAVAAVVAASLGGALLIALALSIAGLRRARTAPVAISCALAAAALITALVAPITSAPLALRLPVILLAMTVAVIGGSPFTRRALDIASGDRVRETRDGGILIIAADASAPRTLMRGGTVIGFLERVAAAVAITVGFPEAVAAVIAVKGIGRFPELGEPEARERFIIGTVASLLWAGAVGAIARLALL